MHTGVASFIRRSLRCIHLPTTPSRFASPLTGTCRFFTSDQVEQFRNEGYLDENGLTIFNTLHEMQLSSCHVYAPNPLFGTYNPESKDFEYMTYGEFGNRVNRCRSMLKDLGKEAALHMGMNRQTSAAYFVN